MSELGSLLAEYDSEDGEEGTEQGQDLQNGNTAQAEPTPIQSNNQTGSNISKPQQTVKVPQTVKFKIPLQRSLLDVEDSDDEADKPAKRVRRAKDVSNVLVLLPAPRHEPIQLEGGVDDDKSDEEDPLIAAGRELPDLAESDSYPIADADQYNLVGEMGGQVAEQQGIYQQPGSGHGYQRQAASQGEGEAAFGGLDTDAVLAAAMAAEREKAQQRGEKVDDTKFVIKEVNADKLKAMDPIQRQQLDPLQTALGTEFITKLREEAGEAPSKLARRRHQLGSLYHTAKLSQLQNMQQRQQMAKSKAETQAKYGW